MSSRLEAFQQSAARAATLVRSRPRGFHWFLACDTDADGLCSAAVTASALRRVGHRITIRASREKTAPAYRALFDETFDGLVALDKGSSHLALLDELGQTSGRPVLVLDHHNVPTGITPSASTVLVNPRADGLDGSRDASAATTAVAFALALAGDTAWPMAPVGLSGAIGDWQHVPDWRGWNLHLLQSAKQRGLVRSVLQLPLIGVTLSEALARLRPHVPGLHGDLEACEEFLRRLGLPQDADVEDLDAESNARLLSALALRLAAANRADEARRLVEPTDHDARLGTSLRHVFRIVDACGREGQAGTGIAFLMGDKTARGEALSLFARYKRSLHEGLQALVRGGTQTHRAVQVAWTENADYTGMVAGLGMEHLVADRTRPLAVLARRPDGLVQVSTRGQETLVQAGLDLGAACHAAASAVGCEGGGHPVAAGAVVPADAVDAFLQALDAALVAQPFRGAA